MASCRALVLRSMLLPDPLHHLNLRAAASAPAAARSTPPRRRRRHLRCCSSSNSGGGGGGDPGQPPQEAVLEAISKVARSKGRVALTTNMVLGGTVADDSGDEWLVLDQKVNSYPTDRGFTAIGTGGDDFVQSMVVAVESILQEPIPKRAQGRCTLLTHTTLAPSTHTCVHVPTHAWNLSEAPKALWSMGTRFPIEHSRGRVSQKLSSRGKYVSVKIGPIRVVSSEQVQAVYRAMRRDNRMKYFL